MPPSIVDIVIKAAGAFFDSFIEIVIKVTPSLGDQVPATGLCGASFFLLMAWWFFDDERG